MLESSLTCMVRVCLQVCLSIMKNPVTLVPCGHTVCDGCACAPAGGLRCGECGAGASVAGKVANESLDALSGKYVYRLHELTNLQKVLNS
jgi:hypothetical protein